MSRAFQVLEALAAAPDGLRLQELSDLVGLHKATVFRLVRTLVQLGYVNQQGERETYALRSGRFLPLGQQRRPQS